MTQLALWTHVDEYLGRHTADRDGVLDTALAASTEAGLPAIAVAPNQGKALQILAHAIGARRVLEIGTLGGFSTLYLARGVGASGHVITLELDPRHAAVAAENFRRAGVAYRVELRVGRALEHLATLEREIGSGAEQRFDLVFIDADKASVPEYFDGAARCTRRGGLIIVDNVVRDGRIADESDADENTAGVRTLLKRLAADGRVMSAAIQTVGAKGHDGFLIAVVL